MNDPFGQLQDMWNVTKFRAWVEMPIDELEKAAQEHAGANSLVDELRVRNMATAGTDDPEVHVAQLDISALALDHGVNEIPQCSLAVALGRRMDDVSLLSPMHFIIDSVKAQIPAKVYVQAEHTAGTAFEDWPAEPFLVFDGLTMHSGFQKVFGQAAFTLLLSHWLVKLSFSSTLSRVSSPTNPMDISFDAAMRDPISAGGKKLADSALTMIQTTLGTAGVVRSDLWGFRDPGGEAGGILEFMAALAGKNYFNDKAIIAQLGQQCDPNNQLNRARNKRPDINNGALDALDRFEPRATSGGYVDGVPLALKPSFDATSVAQRMAAQIAHETPASLAKFTFWDKLVGQYAPNFLFAVIPLVTKALVVPAVAGLRQDGGAKSYKIVYAREFDFFQMAGSVPRPVRGVGLLLERGVAAGGILSAGGRQPVRNSGALYDTCSDGVTIFKEAPPWLANITMANFETAEAVLKNAIPNNMADVIVPAFQRPIQQETQNRLLWQAFAQTLYVNEVLRYRQARLSGKVRFDIAPGSSIAIEVPADRFVAEAVNPGGDPDFLYGQVTRVTTMLNSENCKGSTAYQLNYLRNETEDTLDKYSVADHPVWKTPWYGAPLVDL